MENYPHDSVVGREFFLKKQDTKSTNQKRLVKLFFIN